MSVDPFIDGLKFHYCQLDTLVSKFTRCLLRGAAHIANALIRIKDPGSAGSSTPSQKRLSEELLI